MNIISKTFSFEYAHRVYTQNVNKALCGGDAENSCQKIHGHSGQLTVTLSSPDLDDRGFVLDYKELGFIKNLINKYLDHKTIMGEEDPLFLHFKNLWNLSTSKMIQDKISIVKLPLVGSFPRELLSFFESFTLVNIIPTSENLAKLFYEIIEKTMRNFGVPENVVLKSVSWSETPTSIAIYVKE